MLKINVNFNLNHFQIFNTFHVVCNLHSEKMFNLQHNSILFSKHLMVHKLWRLIFLFEPLFNIGSHMCCFISVNTSIVRGCIKSISIITQRKVTMLMMSFPSLWLPFFFIVIFLVNIFCLSLIGCCFWSQTLVEKILSEKLITCLPRFHCVRSSS